MKVSLWLCAALLVASQAGAQPSAAISAPAAPRSYDGRSGNLDVEPPRIDAAIEVDGQLNEEVWLQAAALSGFSRYAPVDGAPADHATIVLVWYSPTAIYFGIRAAAPAGSVRATLADRDRIQSDDHILIFLGTYNDGRQAMVFGVNPLGVQLDGALAEGTRGTGATSGREGPDYNPDFLFQSKGRVTDRGYDVELRIPFKSLRYQSQPQQDWGIQSLASSRSRAWKTAGRPRSAMPRRFSRSQVGSRTWRTCAAASCSISIRSPPRRWMG